MRPVIALLLALLPALTSSLSQAQTPPANCPAVLQHIAKGLLDGKPETLCRYAGQVVIVVNTASQCGYTPQYESLEALYKRHRARGLVVLGFPANDFGGQEPGANKEIATFCQVNYGVSFPMFGKLEVAIARDPLFVGLARAGGQAPAWNFHKYLIGRDGKVQSYASAVEPGSREFVAAVERALSAR